MKTLKFSFLLSVLVLLMSSCSSDDNSPAIGDTDGSGYFIFDGEEYPLHVGFININGVDNGPDSTTEHEITLITTVSGTITDSQNPVSLLNVTLFSKDGSKPKPGRYELSFSLLDYTSYGMSGFLDPESNDNYLDQGFDTKEGYLELLQSGSTYELEFEFTRFDDKPLTGYYKGKLR